MIIFAWMRSKYLKIITGIALISILFLQGMWLYNTYLFLDKELKSKLENKFARSIEEEVYHRLDNNKLKRMEGSVVEGARPDNDFYLNTLAFHEYLLSYNIPFSLADMDSIWKQKLTNEDILPIEYLLFITDSTGTVIQQIDHGVKEKTLFDIHLKRPLRDDNSEYIQVIIESPYKVVLDRMLLLLIGSLIIAIVIGFCFYLQIKIIMRQNRIAEIRRDFTHAMVHDMKNPITTILMSTHTLKGGKLDDKEQLKKQYFEIILKEGDHLLALANKVLTIAKFEEHRVKLSKCDIDLKELFDKLINKFRIASAKDVEFTTEFNDISTIYADPEYMCEVFSNLIDNAIKYSRKSVTIDIICKKDADNTYISIKDNGIGISLNDQKRIFNKFERVLSKKEEKTSGFGLGLNYIYQAVTAHEGNVTLESVPDLYSKFTVIIPNLKDDQATIN